MLTTQETLQKFGLSEKEVQIYLAGLELGSSTANEISKKSRLNRSTTYDILKGFVDKGITSRIEKNSTTYFEIAEPKRLIEILQEKQDSLNQILPQLEAIREKTVEKPEVKVYEGKEGFKTILNDVLETREQIAVISTSKVFDLMVFEFPHYITERKERGIRARVIQEKSNQTEGLKKHDEKELRETRSIKDFNAESMTWIYGKKVAIVKLVKNEVISVLIKDKTISDDYRRIFDVMWQTAE